MCDEGIIDMHRGQKKMRMHMRFFEFFDKKIENS